MISVLMVSEFETQMLLISLLMSLSFSLMKPDVFIKILN